MSSAGQAIGGIIGAVVGFIGSGFNPMGAYQGFMVGAGIGGMLDPPKGPNVTGPRLTDLSTQTSTYGTNIPRIYGTVATLGNLFWLQGDRLTEVVTVSKQKSGGKGGGGKSTVTTYSYFATFAVGLCQGPIAGVRRIWIGANLVYDAGSNDIDTVAASNAAAGFFKVYLGTETQTVDPRMAADKGAANVPAYRGLAYIVFYDWPLKDYGNSLLGAQVKVELIKTLTTANTLSEITGYPMPNGYYSEMAVAPHAMIAHSWANSVATAYWSQTGRHWQPITLPRAAQWRSMVYNTYDNENLWLALSENGYLAYSTDTYGLNWVERSPRLTSYGYWQKMAISPDGILVIAGASGRIATGQGHVAYMTISEIQTGTPTYPGGDSWNGMVHDGNVFCLVSYGAGVAWITTDGRAWSSVALSTVSGESGFSLAAHNGQLLIVSNKQAHLSVDHGQTWTASTLPRDETRWGVTYCGRWLAWRASSLSDRSGADVSDDGINWTFKNITNIRPLNYSICTTPDGSLPLVYNLRDTATPKLYAIAIDLVTSATADLDSIIATECGLSGLLEASDIDVSAVSGAVRGYRVTETGALRAALEPLQGAFPFDVVPRGYKIHFVPRGGSSVATIPEINLGAVAVGNKPGLRITNSREMDSQLPRRVVIKYFDNAREYDVSEQYAERLNTEAINLHEMQLPLVLTATEAAGVAEKLLYLYWLERNDVQFTIPAAEYNQLEPGDVVTITGEQGTYELRLQEINYTSTGLLECSAKYSNSAIYTSTAQGEEGGSTGRPIVFGGPSFYVLLDIPCMQDVFNSAGFMAAMCGISSSWPGGVIFRSTDEGQTWTDLQGFTGSVPIGLAATVLASGRTDIIDATNLLTVRMLTGELFSITEVQMLNGANHFAIGAHGRWEIVAAKNCDLQPDGSYILSDLLRGRFGTEWAVGLHAAGDTVILLTDADMAFIGSDSSSIGLPRLYRGITNGGSIDSDVNQSFTYAGVNLKPLSPVYLNGNRHPSTNDWTLEWMRRSRVDAALRDFVDAALGETTESYEIDIFADGTYAAVKRTLTASSATVAYTSAQQVADFGSNQSTLYVKVYQLSATVGRGYALTASITR